MSRELIGVPLHEQPIKVPAPGVPVPIEPAIEPEKVPA